tara:strand:- start:368 stop:1015 length:648 start_codon:yes stop_codon:yes gene_type:complete
MAKYFNYFSKTFYTSDDDSPGLDTVTNIISRFAFENSLKENSAAFYPYNIQESDTPEIIARKFYDNSERHWIVLLFNNIVDPQWDWPLKEKTLIDYIDSKYSANGAANTTVQTGIAWAMSTNNVQSYFKIITRTSFDGTETIEKLSVDANTYANVTTSLNSYTLQDGTTITQRVTKETQSYYQYEVDLNEAKRTIKLIKPEFVPAIEKEFKKVIK